MGGEQNSSTAATESSKRMEGLAVAGFYKVYGTVAFQLFLFVIAVPSAFMLGVIRRLGVYLIPLIDRERLVSNIIIYALLVLGIFALLRGFLLAVLYIMIDIKTTFRRQFWGYVLLVIVMILLFLLLSLPILSTVKDVDLSIFDDNILQSMAKAVPIWIVFAVMWYVKGYKWAAFSVIALTLSFSCWLGMEYSAFLLRHKPDFAIQTGAGQKYDVNIIFRSADGILAIDKKVDQPIFLPWHQIKVITLSAERMEYYGNRSRSEIESSSR
jgi:hypothetical protein